MTKIFVDSNGHTVPIFEIQGTQSVAYTDTAGAIGTAVAAGVRLVRVWCTTNAFVVTGAAPVADTADMPITGLVAEYIPVEEGDKVSAVQVTANGTLYVTELL